MASIVERKGKYSVVYRKKDAIGETHQRWETFDTKSEALRRKQEIEKGFLEKPVEVSKIETVSDMMREYISIYGVNNWAMSTYEGIVGVTQYYIVPIIGDMKLSEVTTRVLDQYYLNLLQMKPVGKYNTKSKETKLTPRRVKEIHKVLRAAFNQALRWGVVDRNPAIYATLPKVKKTERAIWTAEQIFQAIEVCEEPRMKLALNLAFSCSLRIGEMLGLTWDCVDIKPEKIKEGTASIYVNKELQRVEDETLKKLKNKDVIMQFPKIDPSNKTRLVLKTPKTTSSVRRIYLPESVAGMLTERKAEIKNMKKLFGGEFKDYNLVFCHENGRPIESSRIHAWLDDVTKKAGLPKVVFHSLRHSSVTYKLKLNGGDIKAVQGDSGHSQVKMVTDVYSHIIDEDRMKNAQKFEEVFYKKKEDGTEQNSELAVLIGKLSSDPKMMEFLKTLADSMK